MRRVKVTDGLCRNENQLTDPMKPTTTQNLNSKLSPPPRADSKERVGISWSQSAIRSSAPPVRIVGVARRYQGGYRVNV